MAAPGSPRLAAGAHRIDEPRIVARGLHPADFQSVLRQFARTLCTELNALLREHKLRLGPPTERTERSGARRRERIYKLLEASPASLVELQRATGTTAATVSYALDGLRREGRVFVAGEREHRRYATTPEAAWRAHQKALEERKPEARRRPAEPPPPLQGPPAPSAKPRPAKRPLRAR